MQSFRILEDEIQKVIHRLKKLVKINKVFFVALCEPFVDQSKIEGYKRFLVFQHCLSNITGKVWCFWNYLDQAVVFSSDEQPLTANGGYNTYFITDVYAKCTTVERKELWESIEDTSRLIDGPWCIGGDFNVIKEAEEKLGGNLT